MSDPREVKKGVDDAGVQVALALNGVLKALVEFLSKLDKKNSPEALAQLRQVKAELDAGLKQEYNRNNDLLIQNKAVQKLPSNLPKLVQKVVDSVDKTDLQAQAKEINDSLKTYLSAVNNYKKAKTAENAPEAPTPTAPRAGKS